MDLAESFEQQLDFEDDGEEYDVGEDSSEYSSGGDYKDSMPAIVVEEMERRKQMEKNCNNMPSNPPSPEVVQTLREHFLSGEANFCHGGFIDCCGAIGIQPRAKDELVYLPEHNLFSLVRDMCDDDDKAHEARVRLLRYREYIDDQSSRGIYVGEDWYMSDRLDLQYEGEIAGHKYDLTRDQLIAFGDAFCMQFYYLQTLIMCSKELERESKDLPRCRRLHCPSTDGYQQRNNFRSVP